MIPNAGPDIGIAAMMAVMVLGVLGLLIVGRRLRG